MINWDEFEHIHVIQKLKSIINQWWNIETVFTDDRGVLQGFIKDKHVFKNLAVRAVLTKEKGVASLSEFVQNSIED